MAQKKITRIKALPAEIVEALRQRHVITCKDFLNTAPLELMNILNYSHPQLQALNEVISKATAPNSKNVLSMYQDRKNDAHFVPTSLHKLDSLLRGGIRSGMITEITGPPGCGKTQFCIMLSAVTALPVACGGKEIQVAYIDTEGAFSAERLLEVAKYRFPSSSTSDCLLTLASSVHVFTEMTCDQFIARLDQLEETIVDKGIGLVIVDSIASLVRKEFDATSGRGVADRAALLSTQAARLKYIAESFNIPVLVTNQITTKMSHDQPDGELEEVIERGVVTAALGNSWSHCVNTRLLLQYKEEEKRILTVAKSPLCCRESCVVTIEDKGLVMDWEATGELSADPSSNVLTCEKDPQTHSLAVQSTTTTGIGPQYPGQLM